MKFKSRILNLLKRWSLRLNPIKIQGEIERLRRAQIDKNSQIFTYGVTIPDEINILESRKSLVFNIFAVIIPLLVVVPTIWFSYLENKRMNNDFESRNRPYLVIRAIEHSKLDKDDPISREGTSEKYTVYFKNVGVLPAKILGTNLECQPTDVITGIGEDFGLSVIGNGEESTVVFPARANKSTTCVYSVLYGMPISAPEGKTYETKYELFIHGNGDVTPDQIWME